MKGLFKKITAHLLVIAILMPLVIVARAAGDSEVMDSLIHSPASYAIRGQNLTIAATVNMQTVVAPTLKYNVGGNDISIPMTQSSTITSEGITKPVYKGDIPAEAFTSVNQVSYYIEAGSLRSPNIGDFTISVMNPVDLPTLAISEVFANPKSTDYNEYLELVNLSTIPVDLYNYKLMHASGDTVGKPTERQVYLADTKGQYVLDPGKCAIVWFIHVDCYTAKPTQTSISNFITKTKNEQGSRATGIESKMIIPVDVTVPDHTKNDPLKFNLANSDVRQILICPRDGIWSDAISSLTYNDVGDLNDATSEKSCVWKLDDSGSINMVRIRNASDPTPGYLENGQTFPDYNDLLSPILFHNAPTADEKSVPGNYTINYTASDDKFLVDTKLFYKTDATDGFVEAQPSLIAGQTDQYSVVIPEKYARYTGTIEYYMTARDTVHNVTLKAYNGNNFIVTVKDEVGPVVKSFTPEDYYYYENIYTPSINANFFDASGIKLSESTLTIGGQNVTSQSTWTSSSVSYNSPELPAGDYTAILHLVDNLGQASDKTVHISLGDDSKLNFYTGELHSHTQDSDGTGTYEEAYTYARDTGGVDFFAVTDHNHYMTPETYALQRQKTEQFYAPGPDGFIPIYGWEMTYNSANGFWGHLLTLNALWEEPFLSDTLQQYYSKVIAHPETIGIFAHPGISWGNFDDYNYLSNAIDNQFVLQEVKGPSYDQEYARSLTKGWHVSPAYSEDNHSKGWTTVSPALTYVLAPSLTRQNLLESMRKNRTYCTTDKNLKISYKVNGQWLGSRLKNPSVLNFTIDLETTNVAGIGLVEIVSEDNIVVASKSLGTATKDSWTLALPPEYDYYYLRITNGSNYAVTAPIWVENTESISIRDLTLKRGEDQINSNLVTATATNNTGTALSDVSVSFYVSDTSGLNLTTAVPVATTSIGNLAASESACVTAALPSSASKRRVTAVVSASSNGNTYKDVRYLLTMPIILTELSVSSSPYNGTNDPFEFIELYNNTNQPLPLSNISIGMWTTAGTVPTAANTYSLASSNITMNPGATIVIWTKAAAGNTLTVDDFNTKFGTHLTLGKDLYIIEQRVMDDSGSRQFDVYSGAETVARIQYNYGASLNQDVAANTSIQYGYTSSGVATEVKLSAKVAPTPGTVSTTQVPEHMEFAISGATNKVYGDDPFTVSAAGGIGNGAITFASSNPSVATVNETNGLVTVISAGSTVLSATKASDGVANAQISSLNLTVSKKPISILADEKSKIVSEVDPELTFKVTPSITGLSALTGYLLRDSGESSGVYTIKQGTLTEENNPDYAITYVSANLTIYEQEQPLVLTGVIDKMYGDIPFTVTTTGGSTSVATKYASLNDKVAKIDEATGQITITGTGATIITATKVLQNSEQTCSATLNVSKKPITITVQPQTKLIGNPDPAFSYNVFPSIAGLAELSGQLTREVGENLGSYAINQGTLTDDSNPNYTITYIGANLSIGTQNQEPLVLSGLANKVYGDGVFAISVTGGSGTGLVSFTSSNPSVATIDASSGSVTILKAGETLITATKTASGNFAEKTISTPLTVSRKAITIKANDIFTYLGVSDPLTYSVSPSITGLSTLNGSLSRATGLSVGSYAITQGSLTDENNTNYLITFIPATYYIQNNFTGNNNSNTNTSGKTSTKDEAALPVAISGNNAMITAVNTPESKGVNSYTITTEAVSQALNGLSSNGNVIVNALAGTDETKVAVSIPSDAVYKIAVGNKNLEVDTNVAKVTLAGDIIKSIVSAQSSGDMKLTVQKADISSLSDSVKAVVGEKPVLDISLSVGNNAISDLHGSAKVSIPYTPASGEDLNAIIIYYIDSQGKLNIVKNCVYDPSSGTVAFTTTHFSKYAVGYIKIDFTDTNSHWANNYIDYLSSRGIVNGTNGRFLPDTYITRGQFTKILAGVSGVDVSGYSSTTFNDVGKSNIYLNFISWANEKGIIKGTGNNKFEPDLKITREQIVIMLERYFGAETISAAEIFDSTNGLITNPKDNATRGEVAKIMTKLMIYLLKN